MATKKKLLQAAAGSAGGAGLNVEEVFSTYLLDNSGTVNNGIDLAGEGGLLWTKWRSGGASAFYQNHFLYDTERGYGSTDYLHSNNTDAAGAAGAIGSGSFNSDGFTTGGNIFSGNEWASWTFRKAPKFFDVVTYTGTGSATTVSHSLGSVPGCIIVKRTNTTANWAVYHRGNTAAPETDHLQLNLTDATVDAATHWNDTAPTDSVFTVGTNAETNASGSTYVAYLWAHNDGDGGFGPNGDADIIKCGSYTGTGSAGLEIDLGFEPQWFLMKRTDTAGSDWFLFDVMRGFDASGNADRGLRANTSEAESNVGPAFRPIANGVEVQGTFTSVNASGETYIYIAIRRGPMAVPESATDVFAIDLYTGNTSAKLLSSGFPVDTLIGKDRDAIGSINTHVFDRMRGQPDLRTSGTSAETSSSNTNFDRMDGVYLSGSNDINFGGGDHVAHMWRRAPNFFDVVAYTGTGSNQTISHNLGVAPKFIIVKERTTANNWVCYLEALGNDKRMGLNAASSVATDTTAWQSTTPTDSAFYVGANSQTNVSGEDFIAYLFGEVSGISKFGTYTGTGAAQNIDCGFSSGARFVLTKTYAGTNPNADWNIWDSERGIVAGNDPYLALNSTNAEVTSTDVIDPYSSGFSLTSSGVANNSGTSYWFYAIA